MVDDNATNRRILEESLRGWQMLPTSVAGAADALLAVEEANRDGRPFSLILTDAHMPATDGFNLVAQIRRDFGPDGAVIMMLTSGDRPNDDQRCAELGIAAYLIKPIKNEEVVPTILRLLRR